MKPLPRWQGRRARAAGSAGSLYFVDRPVGRSIEERLMTTRLRDPLGGGRFLNESVDPADVFTREDLGEEQLLFGQTAAEFMRKEVQPREEQLYAHDWVLTRELL